MSGTGLIVAAPKSGSGKTLLVAGLLRHLRDRGIRVAAGKCGPDYIDPTFHTLAIGRPCINLDPWAMRAATLAGLVRELERDAELVLCEGVMGLFDGAGPGGEAGSTAELARLTGWPVILVADASGQGASIAALAAGFAQHDPDVPLAGLILNRVAGKRHAELLTGSIARYLPELPVLGLIAQDETLHLPARHLGLIPAGERGSVESVLAWAAAQVADAVDVDRLLALARPATRGDREPCLPSLRPLGQRIAVARDDAFLFAYEAMLADWHRQGAAILPFSPLADEGPARDADAIYLPGGYPELHAGKLAAARGFLDGLRAAASAGTVIYGECGGYMVLGEALIDDSGEAHRMAALLPLTTSFSEPRRHLGYRAATLLGSGPLGLEGARFRGHEFHYAGIIEEGNADRLFSLADAGGQPLGDAGLRRGSVAGSFIHLIDRED